MKSFSSSEPHSRFFLNQRILTFLLVLISFLGIFSLLLPNRVWAMEPLDYYREYFKGVGFSVFLPNKDELPEELQKYSSFLRKVIPNFPAKSKPVNPNDWQLILSSNVVNSSLGESDFSFSNTIFICDSLYENSLFSCSDKKVKLKPSANLKIEKIAVYGQESLEVARGLVTFPSPTSQRNILIIPENLLYTPKYREKLDTYLSSFASAEKLMSSLQNPVLTQQKEFNLLKSWGIEVFCYSFAFTAFTLVFRKFLVALVYSPKKFLLPQTYLDFFALIFEFIKGIRKYLLVAIVSAALFFPVLIVITHTSLKSEFNSAHLLYLIELVFSPALWKTTLPSVSNVSLIFYGYLILWFLIVFHFLPNIIDLLTHSFSKIFVSPRILSEKLYKKTLLLFVLLGIFLGITGTLPDLFSFLIILFLLVLYLIFLGFRQGISFSAKERILTLSLIVLTFLLGIGVNFLVVFKKPSPKSQELFAVSNKLIMLPYVKTHSAETYFKPFTLKNFEHTVFVDDYLVFHPSYPKIKNLSLNKTASFKGNFWIMGMGQEDLEYLALSFPKFREAVAEKDLSHLIFPSQDYTFESLYSAKLTTKCMFDTDPFLLSLKISYLKKQAHLEVDNLRETNFSQRNDKKKDLESREVPVLLFPGCLEGETKTFSLFLDLPYIPSSEILMEFKDVPEDLLSSVELYQDDKKLDLLYLPESQKTQKGKILLSNEQDTSSDTLVVYTYDLGKDQDFVRGKSASVDLGTLVSNLKRSKLVADPLIIWSLDGPVVIRNGDAGMY